VNLIIQKSLTDQDFSAMESEDTREIVLDLSTVKLITSKDLSRLLMLVTRSKKVITLRNANEHIKETIQTLKLENIISIKD
jgi:anti-anti-sigma regulatory factor